MVVLREKSGNKHRDILEIGKITGRMDLEFNFIKMEINMRVFGAEIKDMDKVLIGEMKVESWEENTQEIGLKTKNMVGEHFSIKMETDMMVTG